MNTQQDIIDVFNGFIEFIKTLFDGAVNIWNFLNYPIEVLDMTFTPLTILISGIGILLIALLIKKLVPVA